MALRVIMKRIYFILGVAFCSPVLDLQAFEFHKPQLIMAGGSAVQAEWGYATPCLADLDGDGSKELLVGQFLDGKIQVFKKDKEGNYGKGTWLKIQGEKVKVPGIW